MSSTIDLLRASIIKVIDDDGHKNVCSTAVWERRTPEDFNLFEEYKVRATSSSAIRLLCSISSPSSCTHIERRFIPFIQQQLYERYDTNGDGTLSVDEVFDIFENSFLQDSGARPKVRSIIDLVNAFSADNSGELNLAEFATMMHYISECGNQIDAAIETYNKSKQITHARLVEKLGPVNAIITMKGVEYSEDILPNPTDTPFSSVYGPNQMRCLALVSHNGMKDTMMKFVKSHKNVLKKFRLTGTNSTMTMLRSVFAGDESVVFGPSCMSG